MGTLWWASGLTVAVIAIVVYGGVRLGRDRGWETVWIGVFNVFAVMGVLNLMLKWVTPEFMRFAFWATVITTVLSAIPFAYGLWSIYDLRGAREKAPRHLQFYNRLSEVNRRRMHPDWWPSVGSRSSTTNISGIYGEGPSWTREAPWRIETTPEDGGYRLPDVLRQHASPLDLAEQVSDIQEVTLIEHSGHLSPIGPWLAGELS